MLQEVIKDIDVYVFVYITKGSVKQLTTYMVFIFKGKISSEKNMAQIMWVFLMILVIENLQFLSLSGYCLSNFLSKFMTYVTPTNSYKQLVQTCLN
jgi:hypothetical protein